MDAPEPPKPAIVVPMPAAGPQRPAAGASEPATPVTQADLPPGRPLGWDPFQPQLTVRQREHLARIESKNGASRPEKNSAGIPAKSEAQKNK